MYAKIRFLSSAVQSAGRTVKPSSSSSTATRKLRKVALPALEKADQKMGVIQGLVNYDEHFKIKDIPLNSGLKGVQVDVLLSMVDAMSQNPTFSLEQKKEAMEKAVKFIKGQGYEIQIKSLEGTRQASSTKPSVQEPKSE
jgi:hypothetical protein